MEFPGIPLSILAPGGYIGFSNQRAQSPLPLWKLRIIIIGQALAAGVAAPYTPVQIFQPTDGYIPFGRGSMNDRMIQAAWDCNSSAEMWAMSVPDAGGGVAATYTTTVSAAPTAAGTLALYIAGQYVPVTITAAMTLTQVATAIAAAINAAPDLPVTATSAVGVVTSTVRWKGVTGNSVDFRVNYNTNDVLPAGLALATAAGVASATDPDLASAIAALGDKQWHVIIAPYTGGSQLAELAAELAARRGPLQEIDGIAYSAAKGSQGTLATLGTGMNSPDISIGDAIGPVAPWERAARDGATIAFYGAQDPARPFQTLELTGDIAPSSAERFTRTQREALLHDGISTHKVDASGNVCLERPITTYQLNAAGAPDQSYLDVTTMMTLSYSRYAWRVRLTTKFPRHKLADDDTVIAPGQPIVTPKIMTAELVAFARDMEKAGLWQNVDQFKSQLIVERDATDNSRINALIPPNLISGFRVFAGQIDFGF